MKFLIAGFGSIGRRHFRNLLSLGENDILFYRTNKSVLADDRLQGYPVLSNLEEALSHHPDAVIISNPTALHLEVAIPAARAGCDILLEKPVSHNMERIDQLKKIVEQNGSKVLVGFQFRFHPGLNKVKRIITDGEIGRPLSVRAHWGEYLPDWHSWEDYRKSYSARRELGGGVTLTLCHPIDYLRWIFGEVIDQRSFLSQHDFLDINVEDTAEILLRLERGVLGSIHLNFTQRPPEHEIQVIGTKGTLSWNYYQNKLILHTVNDKITTTKMKIPKNFQRNQLFLDEMDHFIKLVSGEAKPKCTLEDGIKALEIALGALEENNLLM